MLKIVTLAVLSLAVAVLSVKSLGRPRSHGFFRGFAFGLILVLVGRYWDDWFRDPFSPLHLISWGLLLASLLVAGHAFYVLGTLGKPEGGLENTTALVKRGAYRYIRHPLYSSLLLLIWGMLCKGPSIVDAVVAVAASALVVATAIAEEAENGRKFGPAYARYRKATKMFVPFLF